MQYREKDHLNGTLNEAIPSIVSLLPLPPFFGDAFSSPFSLTDLSLPSTSMFYSSASNWLMRHLITAWAWPCLSHSVMSGPLRPHGLHHARPPCPPLSPWICPNSCPLSQWCHLTTTSCVTPFPCPQFSPASGSFPMSWLFRWPKYWSFSIIPSKEHSGLISFRMDCFDPLAVQGTFKSLLQHQSLKASIPTEVLLISHFYFLTLLTIP